MEFCGRWKFVSCDNFDAFLKELGVNIVLRKLALLASPVVTISRCEEEGLPTDIWTIRTDAMVKHALMHFRLDTPFQQTTIDDRVVETVISIEESGPDKERRLIMVEKDSAGRVARISRKIKGNLMIVAMTVNDVKSSAIFQRAT